MRSDLGFRVGGCELLLVRNDITRIAVDAIVNAANSELAGGGGVDGAIHRAGGPEVMRELDVIRNKVGRCPAGQAVVTSAGKLPAKYVIHTVGPIYRGGKNGEPELLASCYSTSLRLAAERQVQTISFPSISTGVYGYPLEEASGIALRTVAIWLRENPEPIRIVNLVQFSEADRRVYELQARQVLASLSDVNRS